MRPLLHPSIEDIRLESVLHALSDPVRAALFTQVAAGEGAQTCQALSCVLDKPIPKSSLSQHFKVLREAGLIRSERQGVEMRNTARCEEVNARFPGVLPAILDAYRAEATKAQS